MAIVDPERRDSAHADHEHATCTARGILCSKCNLSLGHVEANIDAFVAYLAKWRRA